MNKQLFKYSQIAALSLFCAANFVAAQTFTAVVETDQVISSSGSIVNFGGSIDAQELNVFFGVAAASTDYNLLLDPLVSGGDINGLKTELEKISWSSMIDGTSFTGLEWFSGFSLPIVVGQKPVVAFMNASGPAGLAEGVDFGFVEGPDITSTLDFITTGFIQGGNSYDVIVGTPGSLQLTALVPEPSHYAAILGLLGLGFVAWRRRRSS